MSDDLLPLPTELEEWCRGLVGEFRVVSQHGHLHGQARVWRLEAGGDGFYLKAHRQPLKWEREVFAYERWRPAFGPEAPRLAGVYEGETRAILTTALAGKPMELCTLSPEQERRAWKAAGRALTSLHRGYQGRFFGSPLRDGSPSGTCFEDPVAFVRDAFEEWVARAARAGLLQTGELELVRRSAEAAEVFAGERAFPCHGDYTPRNWIVDEAGKWRGVIDFEHSRWAPRMRDLSRWWDRELVGRPDLAEAFLIGYSPETPYLSERELAQVRVYRVLNALGAVVWGTDVGDLAFATWGHGALERLQAEE